MTATERAIPCQFSIALLTIAGTVSNSEGQDDAPGSGVRIIWEKKLDSTIQHRHYFGQAEPDVGISIEAGRKNPIRMAATTKSLYIFDCQGSVERRVRLKKQYYPPHAVPTEEEKQSFASEQAIPAPDGRCYLIRTNKTNILNNGPFSHLRFYSPTGRLLLELGAGAIPLHRRYGETYIAPRAEYMVVFYNGWLDSPYSYLDFYHTITGELIKHIGWKDFKQQKFSPFSLGFSDDGVNVILKGNKAGDLLVFDPEGQLIQRIDGDSAARKRARDARDAIKLQLQPEKVNAVLQRGQHTGSIAEFALVPGQNLGVSHRENILYLFELQREKRRCQR